MTPLALAGCVCLLDGCARFSELPVSHHPADQAFASLSAEFISGYLEWRPLTATSLGLHQYDGQLADYSMASVQKELERLRSFARRLDSFDTNALSRSSYFDFRILRGAVQREILAFDPLQVHARNPMTYAAALDADVFIKRTFAPFEERARSILAILRQAPRLFAAARANLAEALPAPLIETAMQQADGMADFFEKDLPKALQPLGNEPLRAQIEIARRLAILELRAFHDYLKTEKLPKANQGYALGRDTFVRLLDCEMIAVPPEQLLETGLEELRRHQRMFAETASEIDPSRSATEVFQQIQKEHPPAAALIPDTAARLEAIRQFLIDRNLVTVPSSVRAQVIETPQFLRATSFASMDTPGPFERKATEAYYQVTPPDPSWPANDQEQWLTAFNRYTLDVVSIHEANPGHYLQYLSLNASPTPRLRKIFTSYAFTEGWAHYAEQMMLEEGFGLSGPSGQDRTAAAKYRLAQLDEALLRLCRFCVAIQMHCGGMTVDQAAKFFQDHCYYAAKPARDEAIRGTYDPEYLYYTLGKLQLLKLRADFRAQEGDRFNLKTFHDEVLRHGAPPIRLLRELLLKDPTLWPQIL
jgi:uncharacterized protein (DUF885 family)